MVQTIEEFVNRLQKDGVEAGREDGDKIRAEAQAQAQQRLAEAEKQAQQIIAQAQNESKMILARTDSELRLAARDTLLRLQEALSRGIQSVLSQAVQEKLDDGDFLGGLISDVVRQYATADASGGRAIVINVSEAARRRLLNGTIAALREDAAGSERIDLRGTLAEAGFTYQTADGTVEVTVDAVVDALSGIVGAELRERIAAAVGPGSEPQPKS